MRSHSVYAVLISVLSACTADPTHNEPPPDQACSSPQEPEKQPPVTEKAPPPEGAAATGLVVTPGRWRFCDRSTTEIYLLTVDGSKITFTDERNVRYPLSGPVDVESRIWKARYTAEAPDGSGKYENGFDVTFGAKGDHFIGTTVLEPHVVSAHVEDGDFTCARDR